MASTDVPSTPGLVIDAGVAKRNIDRLADYARAHRLRVRPHTKTHKSVRVARMQVKAGAGGLTVAKAGEAEVMAAASDDLLVAYPALDPHRCHRLAALAGRATVRVAVDSEQAVDALASAARDAGATIGILADLDVGFHRTGVQSPEAALALAQHVGQTRGVRLDGLFFYPGHVWSPADQQAALLGPVAEQVAAALALWRRHGLDAPIVSGGSTPTAYQSHLVGPQTEIRPGTYVYNDMNTVLAGFCALDDCAARLVCTVVSTAVPGKVVLDAGTKTLTSDRNATKPESGHGHIIEYPQAKIVRLSEEHGEVDVSACDRSPKLGERVHVIPNHICPCVNLQDAAWWRQPDGTLEPLPIDARGRLA